MNERKQKQDALMNDMANVRRRLVGEVGQSLIEDCQRSHEILLECDILENYIKSYKALYAAHSADRFSR